jgi:hypothetical protein
VRSPAPASLSQNAAYRNLQHDTTREHDPPLKFDPRSSRVAFCCAPFAFAARSSTLRCRSLPKAAPPFQRGVPRRSSESRRPCDLRVPGSPELKDLHDAGDPPRRLSRAPWFVIDVLPRKPGVVPPPARRPRPSFRNHPAKGGRFRKTKGAFHRTLAAGIAPGIAPRFRGRARRYVAPGEGCIA